MSGIPQQEWLVNHSVFEALRKGQKVERIWPILAEAFSPLIYAVPSFLGITLARANSDARDLLEKIWSDELGTIGTLSHPVLFENFHRKVTSRWGCFPEAHKFGIKAATGMIELCGSGPWPIGVAAMKAHEGQFPSAYSSILQRASKDLEDAAEFFTVHAEADIEHSAAAQSLLEYSLEHNIVSEESLISSYNSSKNLIKNLVDQIWSYCNEIS